MRWVFGIAAILLAIGVVLVRMIPVSAASYHTASTPRDIGDYPATGRFTAVRGITAAPEDVLRAVAAVALQTPRTSMVAGSVEDGIMTFKTRSRLWGFPDFTTVSIIAAGTAPSGNAEPLLMIEGRLHYGVDDLGVNKARVQDWLRQLDGITSAS